MVQPFSLSLFGDFDFSPFTLRKTGASTRISWEGPNRPFEFVYLDPSGETAEPQPRPLNESSPDVIGWISVRGQLDGKAYTIVRHWMEGSPAEGTSSRETNPQDSADAVLPAGDLPFVTKANASMFVIDLKNDTPMVKELTGGPLKEYQFVPHGCQR